MFYLKMHSTYYFSYMVSDIWKEGNILIKDALNIGRREMFYLKMHSTYYFRYMVLDI